MKGKYMEGAFKFLLLTLPKEMKKITRNFSQNKKNDPAETRTVDL
jgi:hypothetical protein